MPDRDPLQFDLTQSRSIIGIVGAALRLYGRYPVVLVLLSALVVVPYELIVLLITHAGPLGQSNTSTDTQLLLDMIDLALIVPLVSALQLEALVSVGEGDRPQLGRVIATALPVLPGVAAAEIVAGIVMAVGLLCFVIPGVIFAIRLAVVAQTAAFEHTQWPTSLRRSVAVTRRNALRVFGLLVFVVVLSALVASIVSDAVGSGNSVGQDIAGIALIVLIETFTALTMAVLYFDLRTREP